ncbi:palmitoyltransferase ZDHHC6 [Hyposmocoma kahamanoa]|uniref:palmitoyltransferase ZDHHC6 n=1 Tax=Hyposmocoma kahamanoa TaxID=1477025 RepID=UPI000E6D8F71|nr:palmitoyltransferase ZDHHC6 [Hyposmocoma kahamanoa]
MGASPFRRLLHWGPIAVLCIIKLITWAMVHVIGMWWPPRTSIAAMTHSAVFLSMASVTLYYFLDSLLEGPGFVPLGWKPDSEEDTKYLQFCTVCKGFKAPRSHHCRKCGRCVKKMDHHCPWINCCVGHNNHGFFTLFLIYAVAGCLHASIVLIICVYHALNRVWYVHHGTGEEPMIHLTLTTLLLILLAIGMAVGVVLAVSVLLYFQLRGIAQNKTTIEEWIMEKAVGRRLELGLPPFIYPYDLGWKKNFKFMMFDTQCDGLRWPVRDGCGQYDLTIEQVAQKEDKRLRSRLYTATKEYSGRWVPLWTRPRAALAAPCTDEARLPLQPGDVIRATRQKKHWLFGEKLLGGGDGCRGPRGWFPRDSVVPTDKLKNN